MDHMAAAFGHATEVWFSWMVSMAWQVAALVGILTLVGFTLRRSSARFRYCLWTLVPIRLLLPPTLALMTGWAWWTLPSEPALVVVAGSLTIEEKPAASTIEPLSAGDFGDGVGVAYNRMLNSRLRTPQRPIVAEVHYSEEIVHRPKWRAVLFGIWMIGVCWLVSRIVAGYVCVRRWIADSTPCDEALELMLESCCRHIGYRGAVSVRMSSSVWTPLVTGLRRPVILLPPVVVQSLNPEEVRAVLMHELQHVVRRDFWHEYVLTLVQIAYFFHPCVWLAARQLRRLREQACDEATVAALGGERAVYGSGIVKVAELLVRPTPELTLGIVDSDEHSLSRLRRILDPKLPVGRGLSWWSLAVVVLLGLVLIPSAARRNAAAESPQETPATLTVTDAGPRAEKAVQAQSAAQTGQPEQSDIPIEKSVATANEKPSVPVAAPDEANAATEFWSEGSTVSGRVLDHTGSPVKNAEVLLLGEERIIVDADTLRWFVPESESPKPPSARTNNIGEFRITRENGTADRLAVISKSPLFWVIPRKRLVQADSVDVKLPPAGTLAIECDLPNEPTDVPVMIELTSFDGVAWKNDSLRFHMAESSLVNRGKKVFEHLPPAQYAVQFYNVVQTGRSRLMTAMDRQLVEVTSGKQSKIRFDRKVGRPLSGRVLGLENMALRYALLTINHWGPEEIINKEGRRTRFSVAFDVISIGSDGNFTTDPIPPGKYNARLFGVLDSTPELSSQSSDFSGGISFTIPEQGDLPVVEFTAKPNVPKDLSTVTDLRVRAVDEDGKPVRKMQAMIHTADSGYGPWVNANNGIAFLGDKSQFGVAAADVIIRAEGFVSAVARFEAEERSKLSSGEATITLHRGVPVQLQFSLPSELKWPKETLPETYFDNMQERVRTMRQSVNRRNGGVVDFNILNLRDLGDRRLTPRVAEETPPFHTAIHAPGFLQFFEAGTFTLADVKNDRIEISVPSPANIDVTFEPGEHAQVNCPFKNASLKLLRQFHGSPYSYYADSAEQSDAPTLTPRLSMTDLAPGNYIVEVRTNPRDEIKPLFDTEINTGTYFDRRNLSLEAGKRERIDFRSEPYQPDGFRGSRNAVVRIKTLNGKSAAGSHIRVGYFDGHYGSQLVFDGPVPESGDILLSGITDKVPAVSRPNAAYDVSIQGTRLGSFAISKQDTTEEFEFFLTPGEGDLAPEVELSNLSTGNSVQLSSFRGKVVLLEFWATWCGPCQQPMAKLNLLAMDQSADWKDRVVIVPVSIDGNPMRVKSHIEDHGWTSLDHFWANGGQEEEFNAPAARAFVVSGVPTAILISRP